jgi:hypothetical protein
MDFNGMMQLISSMMRNRVPGTSAQGQTTGGTGLPTGMTTNPGQHMVGYTPPQQSATNQAMGGTGIPLGMPVNPSPRMSAPAGGTTAGSSGLAPWLDPNWQPGLPSAGNGALPPRAKQYGKTSGGW